MRSAQGSRRERSAGSPATRRARLLCAVAGSLTLSALVVASAWGTDNALGAPPFWSWLLTGLQVLALWSAGTRRWWGWLLGAAVQVPWIAYAAVTAQLGFIPGCAVSAAVQTYSFLARSSRWASRRDADPRRVVVYA